MDSEKLDDKDNRVNEGEIGRRNAWVVSEGNDLKLVSSYRGFKDELKASLDALAENNPIAKSLSEKVWGEINENKLSYSTFAQFSKWNDWNQESSMRIAKGISRILFGFEMPRLLDQQNRPLDAAILGEFLAKVTEGRTAPMEETTKRENVGQSEIEKVDGQLSANELYDQLKKEGRIVFITFHPAYSYEEFIEGISVDLFEECSDKNDLKYVLKQGIFKQLCKRALGDALGMQREAVETKSWREIFQSYKDEQGQVKFNKAHKYVLIIDEINRGDMAKIFGELITLIEADKRLGEENQLTVTLPASGDEFGVPGNLYVIGTMNTADRSIALLDVALRRRFGFIEMNPDFDVLREEHIEKKKDLLKNNGAYELMLKSIDAVEVINKKICEDPTIGRDRQIGHSFFFKVTSVSELSMVWRYEIFPLLEEYCYGDYKKINRILFGLDSNSDWISEAKGIQDLNTSNIGKMLDSIQ